ncbi:MAG TPA: HRDC domain-containing protein, partial [Clostridia bacterium]|nr:HRDC domain-containing protein [Clostridia bacterium]
MKITITPKSTVMPIQLELSGHSLELSDMASGSSITVCDEGGRLTVRLVEASTVQPIIEEVKPEAVSVTEPVVQPETVSEAVPAEASSESEVLFHKLVALRKQISSEVRMPPYIIFHDATLRDMCRLLPADLEAMKDVQG